MYISLAGLTVKVNVLGKIEENLSMSTFFYVVLASLKYLVLLFTS